MTLEGRIRELGLHEVCQLVSLSRKTGVLEIHAPLQDSAASIAFVQGAIVDAAVWRIGVAGGGHPREHGVVARIAVESSVLDLLAWRDGEFRFVAGTPAVSSPGVRIAIEPLLVEAAQRAALWERVADRIPGARAVPAFLAADSPQLPLLRLAPQEWEILTRVDGKTDLTELARALGRDLLDVAGLVHGLIGHGVLTLRDGVQTRRRHATPPSCDAIQATPPSSGAIQETPPLTAVDHADAAIDLWIPDGATDAVFDPQDFTTASTAEIVAAELCRRGEEAARRGDLAAAVECWRMALQPQGTQSDTPTGVDVGRIREAIALAGRLHALLQPSSHDALTN